MSATRQQRIVRELEPLLPAAGSGELKAARARARSLPAMLRRHGPLQTLKFLEAKNDADAKLAGWLKAGVRAALGVGDSELESSELAKAELPDYLLRWEAAVEAAGWLKMLVEARCEQAERDKKVAPAAGRAG